MNVTIVDEYTGNILHRMSAGKFTQICGLHIQDKLTGQQIELNHIAYQIKRQSTEISAEPNYELYVCKV